MKIKMNLPNQLTILRMILVPFFILFLMFARETEVTFYRILPLIIFIVASITDTLDGIIARKRNLITDFGKFMDPLADKLLVTAALICFVELGMLKSWFVMIIIAREFIISGFRMIAASKGINIAANYWGKIKTVFQMILVIVLLCEFGYILSFLYFLIVPLEIITIALTIISAFTYVAGNIKVLED